MAAQPSQRSFNHPAPRQDLKGVRLDRSLDNLQAPAAKRFESRRQFGTSIGLIGKNMAQLRKRAAHRGQHHRRAVTVLDMGAMNLHRDQQAAGIGEDMTPAALDLLASIKPPRGPPLSGVLTD